jgi:hypothetical protein
MLSMQAAATVTVMLLGAVLADAAAAGPGCGPLSPGNKCCTWEGATKQCASNQTCCGSGLHGDRNVATCCPESTTCCGIGHAGAPANICIKPGGRCCQSEWAVWSCPATQFCGAPNRCLNETVSARVCANTPCLNNNDRNPDCDVVRHDAYACQPVLTAPTSMQLYTCGHFPSWKPDGALVVVHSIYANDTKQPKWAQCNGGWKPHVTREEYNVSQCYEFDGGNGKVDSIVYTGC